MSRVRMSVAGVALALLVVSVAGCSSDGKQAEATSPKAFSFGSGPTKSTRVGVCGVYEIAAVKKLIGGGKTFRVLPPTAIGKKGDPVTGETCSWQRGTPGKDFMSLQVEARNFHDDAAGLTDRMTELQGQTVGATPEEGVGDGAFSASGPDNTLLQVRSGPYFLTFASHAEGNLEPLPLAELKFVAGAALNKIAELEKPAS